MGMKNETIYIKVDKNSLVKKPNVVLSDIAKMTCSDEAALRQIKQIKLYTFHDTPGKKKKREQFQAFSILKIIELIHKDYPNMEVVNNGEIDFIIVYESKEPNKNLMILKSILLCITFFFGSAFSIMTFNKDVGVSEIFNDFYRQVMGSESSGFTIIEISYSIGLSLGILVFFNHIGRKKITPDPTPLQVQMRKYEQDVDTTFIENSSRKGKNIDVS